jgi:hypothetical protein
MDKMIGHHTHGSHEERKRALLRDAEFYRTGVVHSRAQIKHAAKPEVMFHTVLDLATWVLRTRADALLKPTGTSVSVLAPYALTVLGFIRKRRLASTPPQCPSMPLAARVCAASTNRARPGRRRHPVPACRGCACG